MKKTIRKSRKTKKLRPWWKHPLFSVVNFQWDNLTADVIGLLVDDTLQHGMSPPFTFEFHGKPTYAEPAELVKILCNKFGCILMGVASPNSYFLATPRAIVQVGPTFAYVSGSGLASMERLQKFLQTQYTAWPQPPPTEGPIFALCRTAHGMQLQRIGIAGVPLERGNYAEAVLDAYDHVIADLNTSTPCGRLAIFSGTPGTGKTFLIRSMVREVPQAKFVLIPPGLIQHLGDPELLPFLLGSREQDDHQGPIVLLAEDGDACLTKRDSKEISTLQAVLNLTDGILGQLLDVRIVITTNAQEIEMDEAAIREGRLCKHVEVHHLDVDRAKDILRRLVPNAHVTDGVLKFFQTNGGYTLAQVYKLARKLGWKPPTKDGEAANVMLVKKMKKRVQSFNPIIGAS